MKQIEANIPADKLKFINEVKAYLTEDLDSSDSQWEVIGYNNGVQEASHNTQKMSMKFNKAALAKLIGALLTVKFIIGMISMSNLPFTLCQYALYSLIVFKFGLKSVQLTRRFKTLRAKTEIN